MNPERKVVLFIAPSLDGYIARKDESLDWLMKIEGDGDNGYGAFYDSVDTVVLGRKTYDWVLEHVEGEFPYNDKACYIFTRGEAQKHENIHFVNEDITEFTTSLKKQPGKNIWVVGGGELIQLFLKEKCIDELIITVAPVIIGNGIPLFHEGDYELELELKNVQRFNQFVELHYIVKK